MTPVEVARIEAFLSPLPVAMARALLHQYIRHVSSCHRPPTSEWTDRQRFMFVLACALRDALGTGLPVELDP